GVTSAQAQLNRARSELAGDLLRRRHRHVLQGETDRCVQRCDEALGERTSLVTASLGGYGELPVNVLDVPAQIHGTTMASPRLHVNPIFVPRCHHPPNWRPTARAAARRRGRLGTEVKIAC